MNPTAILRDDHAVSPVVGVALLVGITVILAAAVGTFVLATDFREPPPDVDWTVTEETESGDINSTEFLHSGGDVVDGENMYVVYTGDAGVDDNIDPDRLYGAGDTVTVEFTDDESDEGEVVRIVWENPDSSQTEIIHEHTLTDDVTS